jgi:hypothetical protein
MKVTPLRSATIRGGGVPSSAISALRRLADVQRITHTLQHAGVTP